MGDSSVMEMDGMSSFVMGLRFCATQLPWPLTRVIPILPSSILHPPSSIFHPVHILLCFRTTQTPQPANRSSPFPPPPPPPPPSPSPRRTSLHLSHTLPSICLFSFCPARPSSRRCACICVDLVVGGWGFVSGFV